MLSEKGLIMAGTYKVLVYPYVLLGQQVQDTLHVFRVIRNIFLVPGVLVMVTMH